MFETYHWWCICSKFLGFLHTITQLSFTQGQLHNCVKSQIIWRRVPIIFFSCSLQDVWLSPFKHWLPIFQCWLPANFYLLLKCSKLMDLTIFVNFFPMLCKCCYLTKQTIKWYTTKLNGEIEIFSWIFRGAMVLWALLRIVTFGFTMKTILVMHRCFAFTRGWNYFRCLCCYIQSYLVTPTSQVAYQIANNLSRVDFKCKLGHLKQF